MAKKENNRKDYSARERWLKDKKQGRPKQVWMEPPFLTQDQIDTMTQGELRVHHRQRGWFKVWFDEGEELFAATASVQST